MFFLGLSYNRRRNLRVFIFYRKRKKASIRQREEEKMEGEKMNRISGVGICHMIVNKLRCGTKLGNN